MHIPRIVIAAPMSGSGKTTFTAGLIAAFAARGLHVAPFKVGPDYIDPTYHALAAGRASYNLDTWMLPPERVQAQFVHRAQNADLAIIEGMMGLFDGYSGQDDTGSAAHVARTVDAPVLLIIDASAMAGSAAALIKGFYEFDSRVQIVGVVLNRVGGEGHARMIGQAVKQHIGLPVVGYLPTDDSLNLPERHLGLIPTLEPGRWQAWLDAARQKIETTVDLDRILALAQAARPIAPPTDNPFAITVSQKRATIAVARDAAFNFLYDDNLDLLRAAGAEIVFFSPLTDPALPHGTQAIYLCGGFPELYAADLAANTALHTELRAAFKAGLPIYAECGGLMYLTEQIVDTQNVARRMVGILHGQSLMTPHLTIGYRIVEALRDSWLWMAGQTLRGHEFHYSVWADHPADIPAAYQMARDGAQREGVQMGNLIASYVHLHFLAQPELAARAVNAAQAIIPWGGAG